MCADAGSIVTSIGVAKPCGALIAECELRFVKQRLDSVSSSFALEQAALIAAGGCLKRHEYFGGMRHN
jgi:hypothetical protein